jgi:hypothetical protein
MKLLDFLGRYDQDKGPYLPIYEKDQRQKVLTALGESDVSWQEIERIIKKYSDEKSSFLVGIIGGVIGIMAGIAIYGYWGVPIATTSSAGGIFGIGSALLLWRGGLQWKLERATERVKITLDLIAEEIRKLPEETPPHIKDSLWIAYQDIWRGYIRVAARAVEGSETSLPLLRLSNRKAKLTKSSREQHTPTPKT